MHHDKRVKVSQCCICVDSYFIDNQLIPSLRRKSDTSVLNTRYMTAAGQERAFSMLPHLKRLVQLTSSNLTKESNQCMITL